MTTTEKFNTIYESFINGQRTQTRDQFKKLTKPQRKECINYLRDEFDNVETAIECREFLISIL